MSNGFAPSRHNMTSLFSFFCQVQMEYQSCVLRRSASLIALKTRATQQQFSD